MTAMTVTEGGTDIWRPDEEHPTRTVGVAPIPGGSGSSGFWIPSGTAQSPSVRSNAAQN